MIQEKDFLYRVPVKNALVTAPGKQVRNPEILVDLEGGEFMHGDILDANSTNKLIDQSVKDAIDNSIENDNYVTKDLLEAETSARTKSDEDLNAKIKAEQTRAEGKEKEISDKLATVDASALANEVTRATGVENDLRTAIDTKADATALSNYVLTTALNQQVDTLNAAISAKQNAGNYIPYDSSTISQYSIGKNLCVTNDNEGVSIQSTNITGGNQDGAFYLNYSQLHFVDFQNIQEGQAIRTTYSINGITSDKYNNCLATSDGTFKPISDFALKTDIPQIDTSDFVSKTATDIQTIETDLDLRQRLLIRRNNLFADYTSILYSGITIDGMDSYIYISGSNDYTGENINESGIKVRDQAYHDMYTSLDQNSITINNKTDNEAENIFICTNFIKSRKIDESRPSGFGDDLFLLNENGVRILNGDDNHVLTSDCSTIDITQYALKTELPTVPTNVSQLTNDSNFITQQDAKYALSAAADSLRVSLSKKQDKITVNGVDVTDIETADITKLRTIVIELIDALTKSGLIRQSSNLE